MSEATFDAIVVGAGPAGSAAATGLASSGQRVLLLEKDSFPRDKVCGEFLSAEAQVALRRLGVMAEIDRLGPERIEAGSVHPPGGARIPFELPAPALGVSRRMLDALLARRAALAGAEVRFCHRVTSVDGDLTRGFHVRTSGPETESGAASRVVIGAWGRWNALDRRLERSFVRRRESYLGWSRDFVGGTEFLRGKVRLYFFPGGYCGLSRVEGGEINLAGIVSEAAYRRMGGGWEAVVAAARRANPALAADLDGVAPGPRGFLGVGPVFFTAKPPVEAGMLMVGDAAGVIDPFSGQGQAAALNAGLLAAEVAQEFLSGSMEASAALEVYARRWRAAFRAGFAWSSAFRAIVLHPRLGALAGRIAGKRLVRLAIAATRRGGAPRSPTDPEPPPA